MINIIIKTFQFIWLYISQTWQYYFDDNYNRIIEVPSPLARFPYSKKKRSNLVDEINNKFENLDFGFPTISNQIIS